MLAAWRILLLFLLLQPIVQGAFSSYLRNLLKTGTTPAPPRKGRPVDQGGESTDETDEPTDGPGTTEVPSGSTIGSTQPPGTAGPEGTTMPPGPGSTAPLTEPTGAPGGSTTIGVSTTTRCTVGVWSEWREEMSCNSPCGACGTVVRRRTCTTAPAGCPCDGDFRETRACRISACPYPQPACCPPATLIYVNGTFACGPQNDVVMAEYLAELTARASTTTRAPTSPILATRPLRTSPGGGNGNATTTTSVSVTTCPGPTPGPTEGPGPEPTGPQGTDPTGAPATTEDPGRSTGAPVVQTTEGGGGEKTTAEGDEAEPDRRPWYHRLKPMVKPFIQENLADPFGLQYQDLVFA